jgi:hypothetical protein
MLLHWQYTLTTKLRSLWYHSILQAGKQQLPEGDDNFDKVEISDQG